MRNSVPTTLRGAVTFVGIAVATVATLSAGNVASAEILPTGEIVSPPNACTPEVVNTRLIEWDVEPLADIVPGALVVDDQSSSKQSKLWFVTRNGDTRLYRLTPGKGIKKDKAEAKSWPLGAISTGGVRLRHSSDGRNVFVNTRQGDTVPPPGHPADALVVVDTQANTRVTWHDRPEQTHMSDVSVDTRGGGHTVFTAALEYQDETGTIIDGGDGVVQRLRPGQAQYKNGKWVVPADVTRWLVGGGAGACEDTGIGAPCIPGVVVDRRRGHPIFFSAPDFVNPPNPATAPVGAIGELDPQPVKCTASATSANCAKVRYWPLPAGTKGPRQILIDDTGKVWGITTSGHLFSLEVDHNYDKGEVTRHDPIGPATEDLFAVAPDGGTIGFTDSENNEVSVLFPQRVRQKITPVKKLVETRKRILEGDREAATFFVHMVDPRVANAVGSKYTNPGDGTYVETDVNTAITESGNNVEPSMAPTGMQPDGARKTGSFFYGVTFSGGSNRVGQFEIKVEKDRELEFRRDDDDFDDDGDDDAVDADDDGDGILDDADTDDDNDCEPDTIDKDKDNDGIEDEFDSKTNRENKRIDRGTMAPGESKGYEMEADSHSVSMLAIVEAAELTTPLSIEIVDPNGVVVLTTPPALGKAVATSVPAVAGVYTIRVTNNGGAPATYKTTLIGKTIWF